MTPSSVAVSYTHLDVYKRQTKFGAFVALPEGKSGMVHISEVASSFVSDIKDFLTEGQSVKVKVLSTENGKINLSIKRL